MKTLVIFRKFRKGGDVLALFPLVAHDRNGYQCQSYQHIGQHGAADPYFVTLATVPAKPAEYFPLAQELIRLGYDLKVGVKIPRNAARIRRDFIN